MREVFDINGLAQIRKKAQPLTSKHCFTLITELQFRFSPKPYRCDFMPEPKKEYDFHCHQNHRRISGYTNSARIKHYGLKAQGIMGRLVSLSLLTHHSHYNK
jgi:hypothetical protein